MSCTDSVIQQHLERLQATGIRPPAAKEGKRAPPVPIAALRGIVKRGIQHYNRVVFERQIAVRRVQRLLEDEKVVAASLQGLQESLG